MGQQQLDSGKFLKVVGAIVEPVCNSFGTQYASLPINRHIQVG
jgi:hypothetical protein